MTNKLPQNQLAKVAKESWLLNLGNRLSPEVVEGFLFSLFLLFLPTQFGKHFWPSFSFVLGERIDYLSPTLYVTDVLVVMLFLVTLFKKQLRIPSAFTLVILFISFSIFLSQSPMSGWYWLLKFLEISFVVWYVAHVRFPIYHLLFTILSAGILFESLLTFLQVWHQGSLGALFYFFGERAFSASTPGIANASVAGQLLLRPYATFSHPNVLAGYLQISMLLAIYFSFRKKRSPLILNSLFFTLSMGSLALFLTLSRVAIVAWITATVSLFYFFAKNRLRRFHFISLAVVLTGILLSFVFFPQLFLRFATSFGDESVVVREQLASAAFSMIATHPIFGVGPNNFLSMLPSFSKNSFVLQPVHNIYLLVASELGLPGPILFVGFLFFLGKKLLTIWRQSERKEKMVLLPLILAFSSILFIGFFDHYFLTLQQGQLLLGVIIGVTLGQDRKRSI